MNVKEFVEKYNKLATDNLKKIFISDNLEIKPYISYVTKIDEANIIVNATSYRAIIERDTDGNIISSKLGNIKVNTALRYALVMHSLIRLYTNIEVNKEKFLDEFDMLNEYGLIEVIIKAIPKKEFNEFNTIVSMVNDDFMTNYYETHAFIENQIQRISDTLGMFAKASEPLLKSLSEKIENMNEADVKKFSDKAMKILKKVK